MAQYEVPQNALPQTGRDVQCSNCDHRWFQKHPNLQETAPPPAKSAPQTAASKPTPARAKVGKAGPKGDAEVDVRAKATPPVPKPADTPAPEPQPTDQARKPLDPAVADILRQEAAHEAKARAQEAPPLETQTDLGLTDPAPAPKTPQSQDTKATLPDVDDLTATLAPAPAKARGFRTGFALALALCAALLLCYIYADQLAANAPSAKPILDDYVAAIDQLREWLRTQIQSGTR
jgi:predicted Zn finger-like uncharacterized protein